MNTKYVFATGGVVSGLGKGITVASLGMLLSARGFKVVTQKFDPYINIDTGNLNPIEHGEVFVTDDGTETDLDLGHYERFTDISLTENSSMTMGKIYWSVLNKERNGEYGGATVQVIPHITNEIKGRIRTVEEADIVITEVGGTVGDIESLPVLEAIRQLAHDVGRENVIFVHITLVPHLDFVGEMKTKPSQHSVKELQSKGIQPDIIVCRSDRSIPKDIREKLALFCNVEKRCVLQNINVESIYEVPLLFEEESFADIICDKLKLPAKQADLAKWRTLVDQHKNPKSHVTVGLVGRYTELWDSYLSVVESLNHAGIHQGIQINVKWLSDKDVSEDTLADVAGIVIADAVGEEFSEGEQKAIHFAQEKNIPFLGIGSGMYAVLKEFANQIDVKLDIEADNRGAKTCKVAKNSKAYEAYKSEEITERYRSYCNIPAKLKDAMTEKGWLLSENGEIAELSRHPWFVCVQFHPEYKSRVTRPSPIFYDFVGAISSVPYDFC